MQSENEITFLKGYSVYQCKISTEIPKIGKIQSE